MTNKRTALVVLAIAMGACVLITVFARVMADTASPEEFLNEWKARTTLSARTGLEYELLREGFTPAEVEDCFVWAFGLDWRGLDIRATLDRWRALHPDEPVICDHDDIRRGNAIIIGAWKQHRSTEQKLGNDEPISRKDWKPVEQSVNFRSRFNSSFKDRLEFELNRVGCTTAEAEECLVWAFGELQDSMPPTLLNDRWHSRHPDRPVIRDSDSIQQTIAVVVSEWKRHQNAKVSPEVSEDLNCIVWAYKSAEVCRSSGHKWEFTTQENGVPVAHRRKYCLRCGAENPEWVD